MSARRTFEALTSDSAPAYFKDQKVFVLSRGNFASSGRYAAHSLG